MSRKAILFIPGFFGDRDESADLFTDFVPILHSQGFQTSRYDPSGLGESQESLGDIDTWLEDSYLALQGLIERGVRDIAILGFSLGATFAVLNYANNLNLRRHIKALALWAPAFDPRTDMLRRYKSNGEYALAARGELLKSGKQVPTRILDALDFDVINQLYLLNCPVHVTHSQDDPLIPYTTTQRVIGNIPYLDQLVTIQRAGHSFKSLEYPDDLSPRELVYSRTADFIQRVF